MNEIQHNTAQSYLSVGFDVGSDFTWMAIAAPDGSPVGKPFNMIAEKSPPSIGGEMNRR